MKKKIERKPRELWDQPVPPVKGAVTEPEDMIRNPDKAAEEGMKPRPTAEIEPQNWL